MAEKEAVKTYTIVRHYGKATVTSYSTDVGDKKTLTNVLNEILDRDRDSEDCQHIAVKEG